MRTLSIISYSLMTIGALNWGLVGMFDFDLVAFLFGNTPIVSNFIYSLVGISAIASLALNISQCTSEDGTCCILSH